MKILIADDDPLFRRLTQRILGQAEYDVIAVENGYLATEQLFRSGGPRLALLDWVMPGLDGPAVCRAMRSRADQPYVYIILLTSKESKDDLVAALEAGADDYLTKPFNAEELKARLRTGQRILQLQDRLYHDARHDVLTQLPNRAFFMDRLCRCAQRSTDKRDYTFAVLFVDLDHFKSINDRLGHAAGDELLSQVGERLRGSIRRYSASASGSEAFARSRGETIVARLGGDEFTVLMDDIGSAADAAALAERIHSKMALPFSIGGNLVRVGASIGVSISKAGGSDAEAMLREADGAMYEAKAEGRLVLHSQEKASTLLAAPEIVL